MTSQSLDLPVFCAGFLKSGAVNELFSFLMVFTDWGNKSASAMSFTTWTYMLALN